MGSSKASTIVMSIAAALLLLVAVTDARRGGGRGGNGVGGMDDCGRNSTCRELSRECKKMFIASMVDNYVDAGDDEIITTVEKMAAMMEMLMEHQKNLTDCGTETGIELPNSGGKNYMAKAVALPPGRKRKGAGGGKWRNENFGVSEEEAKELNKCLLNKKGLLNSDATLNREAFKDQITSAFDSQPGVQTAVEEAVDSCPEPKDYNIQEFVKCINKACIDNLELDGDEDSPKETSQ